MISYSLHLHWLQLKQPWAIASRMGNQGCGISQRGIWLIKLQDERKIVGFGEVAPVTTYGEDLVSALRFLREFDWSKIGFDKLENSLEYLHSAPGNSAAKCGIETALLDGASKLESKPVSHLLGVERPNSSLPATSYSIGISDTENMEKAALAAADFPIIKLKAGQTGLGKLLNAFCSIRPDARIRIDGNEAWASKEVALQNIELAARYSAVDFIEQPMPRNASEADLAWLKQRSPLPLIADESFHSLKDLERCRLGFHGVNIKLVKAGGPFQALKQIQAAKKHGLKVQLGCMIESSLRIAAAWHLAPFVDWLDLDGALLTQNDPFSGIDEKLGQLNIDTNKRRFGLGVIPKIDAWQLTEPGERPIARRATLDFPAEEYGRSVNGLPLEVYLPQSGNCEVLIFASIHGEEPETTALLSKALRSIDAPSPHCACVLSANPDGTLLGTRGNARGVELNRNFPSANWQPGTVSTKWSPEYGRVNFSTGDYPGSEPETQALIKLVKALRPCVIIALHAPLACIEDPEYSPLGYRLAKTAKLPLVGDIGYETPGSFGTWAKENNYHVITYELPPISVSAMHTQHLVNLTNLLKYGQREPKLISNAI